MTSELSHLHQVQLSICDVDLPLLVQSCRCQLSFAGRYVNVLPSRYPFEVWIESALQAFAYASRARVWISPASIAGELKLSAQYA